MIIVWLKYYCEAALGTHYNAYTTHRCLEVRQCPPPPTFSCSMPKHSSAVIFSIRCAVVVGQIKRENNSKYKTKRLKYSHYCVVYFPPCNLNSIINFPERWICKYTEVQLGGTRITMVFSADHHYSVIVWTNATWAHRVEGFSLTSVEHIVGWTMSKCCLFVLIFWPFFWLHHGHVRRLSAHIAFYTWTKTQCTVLKKSLCIEVVRDSISVTKISDTSTVEV